MQNPLKNGSNFSRSIWGQFFRPSAPVLPLTPKVETPWTYHSLLPLCVAFDADGNKLTGDVMRRKRDGQWEYRAMTPEEQQAEIFNRQW